MPRALIFDLDGTLVDSLPGIATALNRALAKEGFSGHDESTVRSFIGNGSWKLCERGAPHQPRAVIDTLEQHFRDEYATAWQDGTHPYPGIIPLLESLTTRELPLAVFSNKPHSFTTDIVATLFPSIPFRAVLGHRDGAARKPDPAGALEITTHLGVPAAETLFIGDSTVDHATAVNAGMLPLLVDWGYHDHAALAQTGAPVLSSVDQILPALAAPHPGA